jgi:hypothetical protein
MHPNSFQKLLSLSPLAIAAQPAQRMLSHLVGGIELFEAASAKGSAMKFRILLVCFFASGAADAADWVSLGKTDEGKLENFADVSSIRIDAAIRRGSSKVIPAPHTLPGGAEYSSKWISQISYNFAFNCTEKSGRVEGFKFYFDDGTSYLDPPIHYPKPWQAVPPDSDSNWALLMKFVCAWTPK